MKKIHLLILDEYNELLHDCGFYNVRELEDIIHYAYQLKLVNMASISLDQDTYFNNAQLLDMKQEMAMLKTKMNDDFVNAIDNAINLTLKEDLYSYLKFANLLVY